MPSKPFRKARKKLGVKVKLVRKRGGKWGREHNVAEKIRRHAPGVAATSIRLGSVVAGAALENPLIPIAGELAAEGVGRVDLGHSEEYYRRKAAARKIQKADAHKHFVDKRNAATVRNTSHVSSGGSPTGARK